MASESGTAGLVSAKVFPGLLSGARRCGIETSKLFAGLSITEEEAVAAKRLFPWSDYAVILQRICDEVGGLEQLHRIGDHFHEGFPALSAIASAFVSPSRFCQWVLENISATVLPIFSLRYEELAEDRARVTLAIPEPHVDSPPAHWINITAIGNLPRHLGLPPAAVVADIRPRLATYDLRFPPSHTPAARLSQTVHRQELQAVLAEFEDMRENVLGQRPPAPAPLPSFQDKVAASARAWGLSPREAEALSCVVRGLSNKEIAAELGCATATVELHVTRVLQKSGAASRGQLTARFWST